MAYYEGEVSGLNTCNGNNGGFGSDWGDLAALLIVAGLFGWGGNGFGGGSRSGSSGGVMDAYVLNSDFATLQRQIDSGFSGVTAGINQVNQGLCNGFYTTAQQINGVQMQVANEFRGLDNAVCTLGYQTQAGFNALGSQVASCCCDLRAGLQDVKYAIATESCATRQAIADSTNAVIGWLTQEKISGLQAENAGLKAQISNDRQSAYIVNALAPKTPVPAYPVFAPNQSFAYPSGVSFGVNGYGNNSYNNNGCGCGCGCNN